jgi:hypothetical protein
MLPMVLDPTNAAAARASRPLSGMVFGLRGDDLLLGTGQQPLRLGQGQTQVGDITDTVRPADLPQVGAQFCASPFVQRFRQQQGLGSIRAEDVRHGRDSSATPAEPESVSVEISDGLVGAKLNTAS